MNSKVPALVSLVPGKEGRRQAQDNDWNQLESHRYCRGPGLFVSMEGFGPHAFNLGSQRVSSASALHGRR
jgi:hypothetical protein